ncbi:hypothetical protein RUM43_009348 [Polyplax serrata]|uniref:Uncharacterized protein n=1 Tax=Polyplax serrata TaxID=468196 RepID=A0AAN8NZJ1_POLSC
MPRGRSGLNAVRKRLKRLIDIEGQVEALTGRKRKRQAGVCRDLSCCCNLSVAHLEALRTEAKRMEKINESRRQSLGDERRSLVSNGGEDV